jgi:hypothetical protein
MEDTSLLDAPAQTLDAKSVPAEPTSLLDTGKTADAAAPDTSSTKETPSAEKPGTPSDGTTPDAKTEPQAKAPIVPEKYEDPKLPEGMTLNPELKTQFDAVAKELKLSQEQYQKVVDIQSKHTESQIKQTMDLFSKQINDWKDETTKELGPDPVKSLSVAAKAIDQIFTDPKENAEFRDMMKTTGLGNWRLMVKAFSFVGKQISEDRFPDGRPDTKPRKSNEEVFFDHPTSVAAMKSGGE